MKVVWLFVIAAIFLSGCISANYHGETFPATRDLQIFQPGEKLPPQCRLIGTGQASGEFSAVSNDDLREQLKTLGMQHGARFMVITGTRIVPAGKAADVADENFITATDDPDQTATEIDMNEELNPPRSRQTYKRIMYADFLR